MSYARTPPKVGNECGRACLSLGKSCRKCWVDCYRKGWESRRVTRDNARLVAEAEARRLKGA